MAVYRKIKPFGFRDYVVFGELGSGVTGKVYLARRGQDPTLIALKLLHSDADALVRDLFFNEQRLLRKAQCRHVVQYVDGGSEPQHAYLATCYVEGTRLDQLLGAPMPAPAVVQIIEQAAAAIDYLHHRHPDHPIIHCDVAPRNIVVDDQGTVVLLDLSSARTSFFAPADDASLLSPGYCAPEQLSHRPAVSSDQYALAVIAFELITGKRLYPKQKRSRDRHAQPPIRERLPSRLPRTAEVLLRAQQSEPEARYATCGAFAAQLERALRDDHQLDSVEPGLLVGYCKRRQQHSRRGSARQSLALAALVVSAASGLLLAGRPMLPSDTRPQISAQVPTLAPTATVAKPDALAVGQTARREDLIPTATLRAAVVPIERETPTALPTATPVPPTPKPRSTSAPTATAAPTARPRTPVPPKPAASGAPRRPQPTPSPQPAGPRMPDLRNYGENQARAILAELGISDAQIQVQYQSRLHLGALFDQVPAYAVVSSLPEPGASISPVSTIILGIRSPGDDTAPAVPNISQDLMHVQPQP